MMLRALALDVSDLIGRQRFTLSNEKATQAELAAAFAAAGLNFSREYRLSGRDVPDFFHTETGLIVEVKITGAGKMDTFRQLTRYAVHASVQGLLLATNLAMGLPALIESKPAFQVSLGRGWL